MTLYIKMNMCSYDQETLIPVLTVKITFIAWFLSCFGHLNNMFDLDKYLLPH